MPTQRTTPMSDAPHYAGCDVSKATLDVCFRGDGHPCHKQFFNTAKGHVKLVAWLDRKTDCRVRLALEATGTYGVDLCLALHDAPEVELMVVNPRAARRFAEAQMTRSKTDRVDAASLCEFAQRMAFTAWQPPETAVMDLRAIARRIQALTVEATREQNRLGHARAASTTPAVVLNDIAVNLRHLARRIAEMERQAMQVIGANTRLRAAHAHVTSVKGISDKTAVMLLPELLVLPDALSVRQWVAQAGLDPKRHQSGTSVEKRERISKVGNVHIRRALFMPAMVAARWEPHVRAYYERLLSKGKAKRVAHVAVMRKLLHAVYGMLKHGRDFDGAKFYRLPESVAAGA